VGLRFTEQPAALYREAAVRLGRRVIVVERQRAGGVMDVWVHQRIASQTLTVWWVAGAVASGQRRSWDERTSQPPIGWLFSCVDSPKRDAQRDFDSKTVVVEQRVVTTNLLLQGCYCCLPSAVCCLLTISRLWCGGAFEVDTDGREHSLWTLHGEMYKV
jgi:hypothetical protein